MSIFIVIVNYIYIIIIIIVGIMVLIILIILLLFLSYLYHHPHHYVIKFYYFKILIKDNIKNSFFYNVHFIKTYKYNINNDKCHL